MNTNGTETGKPAEDSDEIAIAMAQAQLRCLAEVREAATNMVRALDYDRVNKGGTPVPHAACARLGKLVLQVCAMEQHVLEQWRTRRKRQETRRIEERKKAVQARVEEAMAAIPPGPERVRRVDQLRGLLPKYDFSSPRTMAAMVADICAAVGVPFRPEIWPEEGIEAAAAAKAGAAKAGVGDGEPKVSQAAESPSPPPSRGQDSNPGSSPGQALPHQGGGTRERAGGTRISGPVISAGYKRPDFSPGGLKPGSGSGLGRDEGDLPPVRVREVGRGPP
jgi:hypothetical protein